MLSVSQLQEVAFDLAAVRERMNLGQRDLAKIARVGLRFVMNVEEGKLQKWREHHLRKLLRVLKALERELLAEMVQEEIVKNLEPRKRRRLKFDRRTGGKVLSRRRHH